MMRIISKLCDLSHGISGNYDREVGGGELKSWGSFEKT